MSIAYIIVSLFPMQMQQIVPVPPVSTEGVLTSLLVKMAHLLQPSFAYAMTAGQEGFVIEKNL